MTTIAVRCVAAGTLKVPSYLTHGVYVDEDDRPMCSRVKARNILDDSMAPGITKKPTCSACLKKWNKAVEAGAQVQE